MPARNKGADQTLQTNCESVRKSCCAAIGETGKTQEEFSVRSVLDDLQYGGIPHMIVMFGDASLQRAWAFVLPSGNPLPPRTRHTTGPALEPHAGVDMRKRTQGINVRVTAAEKCKIERSAAGCGLTVSEYLRRRALGYTPKFHPPPELFSALTYMDNLTDTLERLDPYLGGQYRLCAEEIRDSLLCGSQNSE